MEEEIITNEAVEADNPIVEDTEEEILVEEVESKDDEEDAEIFIDEDAEEDEEAEESADDSEQDEEEADEETHEEEPAQQVEEDTRDARIRELEAKLKAHETASKTLLKSFGENTEEIDVLESMERFTADMTNQSVEDYRKAHVAEDDRHKAFEQKAKADLDELKTAFPALKDVQHIRDIPNVESFGRFRDMGLTPIQAYSASNPGGGSTAQIVEAVKQQERNKSHLKTVVPSTKGREIHVSRKDIESLRSLYPNKSDTELARLVKKLS